MEPYSSSSFRNYLPSKKIQYIILIALAIIFVVVVVPKIVRYISLKKISSPRELVINQANPISRDTDGDGVMDWQEILVGLDPRNPETKSGIPDIESFRTAQNIIGVEEYYKQVANVNDTSKLALTLSEAIMSKVDTSGAITDETISQVSQEQLLDYLNARKKQNKTYGLNNLIIVGSGQKEIQQYMTDFKNADIPVLSETYLKKISETIESGNTFGNTIIEKLPEFDKLINNLLKIPVPQTASVMHLAGINALYGMRQTIASYNPNPDDPLYQIGTMTLINDYLRDGIDAQSNLAVYFSIVNDSNQ